MDEIIIEPISELNYQDIADLKGAGLQEGFQFLDRLVTEWISGVNRFDKPGEGLFQARVRQTIVGIGGINNNPYSESGKVGRVRHVYIHPDFRRRGGGRRMITHIIAVFRDEYDRFSLRTDTDAAGLFYESVGFRRLKDSAVSTHFYPLG
ncbi:MAG: GNAT family N-acetyltransferase [Lewinella sp.]|nr:GNAT family N-acetyltransferase [Lewinella sp.]